VDVQPPARLQDPRGVGERGFELLGCEVLDDVEHRRGVGAVVRDRQRARVCEQNAGTVGDAVCFERAAGQRDRGVRVLDADRIDSRLRGDREQLAASGADVHECLPGLQAERAEHVLVEPGHLLTLGRGPELVARARGAVVRLVVDVGRYRGGRQLAFGRHGHEP
jgi:hypothetical protein